MRTLAIALALLLASAAGAAAEPLRATAGLKCRATPSPYGKVVARIAPGDVVNSVAGMGEWTKIEGRRPCWAATRYLTDVSRGVATRGPRRVGGR